MRRTREPGTREGEEIVRHSGETRRGRIKSLPPNAVNVSLSLARPVQPTPITLPQRQARTRYTDAGFSLARAAAADPLADPWSVPLATYEDLQRYHRRPEEIPDGWTAADYHRDSRGSSGCDCA
jgi:hypothetical protein